MSIERTFYCEGPADLVGTNGDRCGASMRTATPAPYLPEGVIETREKSDQGDVVHHFCGWGCLMKYAAAEPEPTVITFEGP
jgi:hypothetical protein